MKKLVYLGKIGRISASETITELQLPHYCSNDEIVIVPEKDYQSTVPGGFILALQNTREDIKVISPVFFIYSGGGVPGAIYRVQDIYYSSIGEITVYSIVRLSFPGDNDTNFVFDKIINTVPAATGVLKFYRIKKTD